jgi:hypothetical protein
MSPLEDGELRWIVLAFDRGNLSLLIDGRCAARATVAVGGQADLTAHMVLGTGFANLYRGAMQQLNVLRWAPTTGHSEN